MKIEDEEEEDAAAATSPMSFNPKADDFLRWNPNPIKTQKLKSELDVRIEKGLEFRVSLYLILM